MRLPWKNAGKGLGPPGSIGFYGRAVEVNDYSMSREKRSISLFFSAMILVLTV